MRSAAYCPLLPTALEDRAGVGHASGQVVSGNPPGRLSLVGQWREPAGGPDCRLILIPLKYDLPAGETDGSLRIVNGRLIVQLPDAERQDLCV